jgi:hypothetical protein
VYLFVGTVRLQLRSARIVRLFNKSIYFAARLIMSRLIHHGNHHYLSQGGGGYFPRGAHPENLFTD